jgi:hypothetical protein
MPRKRRRCNRLYIQTADDEPNSDVVCRDSDCLVMLCACCVVCQTRCGNFRQFFIYLYYLFSSYININKPSESVQPSIPCLSPELSLSVMYAPMASFPMKYHAIMQFYVKGDIDMSATIEESMDADIVVMCIACIESFATTVRERLNSDGCCSDTCRQRYQTKHKPVPFSHQDVPLGHVRGILRNLLLLRNLWLFIFFCFILITNRVLKFKSNSFEYTASHRV